MPRLKVTDVDFDELEDAEWDERDDIQPYDGPEPSVGTILPGYVKLMWWTSSQGGDRMLKTLFVADETAGKYEGCPIWDNTVLTPSVKFRWMPLFNALGITLRDIEKKLYVEPDDDSNGAPIQHIADFYPGQDQDSAYLRVVVGKHKYGDGWQLDASKWLPYEPPEDEEPEDEPEEPEDEYEPEDEPEETPPARPARRTRASTTTRSKPTTPRSRRAAPDEDEPEEGSSNGRSRRSGGQRGAARSAAGNGARTRGKPAKAQPAARGRGRGAKPSGDEPPF